MPDAYWDLESERLVDLAREWLRTETRRGAFEVVACEQPGSVAVGAFEIRTRVDRIDRLPDGELVIIDYKTGEVTSSSWEVPRPDQPQLPIYAVAGSNETVGAIAYAQIKKGKCRLIDDPTGRASGALIDDAARAGWRRRLHDWDEALGALAHEISAGFASANPKKGAQTCRYCDLQALCRLYEPQAADEESGTE
jgi:RecB family exonuclease